MKIDGVKIKKTWDKNNSIEEAVEDNNSVVSNSESDNNIEEDDVEGMSVEISELNDDLIYPAEVRIEKVQFSISHIQNLLRKRNKLVLDPEFQRNKVWNPKQKSELIESILMGIPIPIIYLFEDMYGVKQIVDGKQRITTVVEFLEGEFKLKGLNILRNLNDRFFTDLDSKQQGVFEDFQLFCYVIQPPTPERIKYDIFDRVNRGGTSLNKQEMRNALYGGECVKLLREICASVEFLNATGGSIKDTRMKDQYTVLRVLSFIMLRSGALDNESDLKYKGDIDDFLAKFMRYINNKANEKFKDEYKIILLSALDHSYQVLGEDGFRFKGGEVRRPINMPLMEALVYYFTRIGEVFDTDGIRDSIDKLKAEYDNSKYFHGNIDSTTSIDYRFGEIDKLFNS